MVILSLDQHFDFQADMLSFFVQDEKDFRDKLSSIYVALNFSLDPEAAAASHSLRPILNYQTANVIEQKVFPKEGFPVFLP